MNKHLLFVVHYPAFGGPHNQALRLHRSLRQMGWNMKVLLPTEHGNAVDRLRANEVPVTCVPLHRLRTTLSLKVQLRFLVGFFGDIKRIRFVIRSDQIDLVTIGGLANPQAAIAARMEGVPVVWQVLDTTTPRLLVRVLMPVVQKLAQSILVTGRAVAEAHAGTEKFGKRLFLYYPPVDFAEFARNPEWRSEVRDEFGFSDIETVIGTIGNINPDKDLMTFVRAAVALHKSQEDIRFLVLGTRYAQHSKYFNEIQSVARSGGLEIGKNLVFLDPGSDVARWANAFDLFWLTSRSEGLPTVIGEAQALGLPVVSTDVGAVREAVSDGENGFVVPLGDHGAILQATQSILNDRNLYSAMSKNAIESARNNFGVERCAEIFDAAFCSALEQ